VAAYHHYEQDNLHRYDLMPFVDGAYRVPVGLITSGPWVTIFNDLAAAINEAIAEATAEAIILAKTARGFMINGKLVPSVASNALTVAIKTLADEDPSDDDPVRIVFRSPTADSGDYEVVTLTAATSFVVSSGSTLGTSNNIAFRLWFVAFKDGNDC